MEILSGELWNGTAFEEGYVVLEDGIVREVGYGSCPYEPSMKGCIMPGVVDGHTHLGDSGLKLDGRYDLLELVAPPDGLKHRYLNGTPREKLVSDMGQYSSTLISNGASHLIDFREGGVDGARMLREACPKATILGRPVSKEFDPNEIVEILDIADGIGIPGPTDLPQRYIDAIADAVHRKGKILSIHASERVRDDIDKVLSIGPDFIVHMVQATDDDLRRCAEQDVPIVVCASSNTYFGMVPPIKRMIDVGVKVAMGTDNGMLSPTADMFDELSCFWHILSEQGGKPSDAYTSLIAHGCDLLYASSLIGEQTGRKADLIVFPSESDSILRGKRTGRVRYGP